MAELPGDLLSIADELYGLPLSEFTPARDARAKELKGSDLAGPVKALAKPSTAAWVVNLLVRRETEQVEQVLAVGTALREAQASMSGEEPRSLTRQRRQLTAAVTTQAGLVQHVDVFDDALVLAVDDVDSDAQIRRPGDQVRHILLSPNGPGVISPKVTVRDVVKIRPMLSMRR